MFQQLKDSKIHPECLNLTKRVILIINHEHFYASLQSKHMTTYSKSIELAKPGGTNEYTKQRLIQT